MTHTRGGSTFDTLGGLAETLKSKVASFMQKSVLSAILVYEQQRPDQDKELLLD